MNKLFGVVLTLVCLNSFAETEYWSVGSFNVLSNAMVEQIRISEITGLSVQIATFVVSDVSTYRLVVEKDSHSMMQREKMMDAGITPWSVKIDSEQLGVVEEGSNEFSAAGMDYFLVLGGFRGEIQANNALLEFENGRISKLQIEETSVSEAPWFRVLHGPFDAPFDTVLADLRAYGVAGAWWVKRESKRVMEADIATEEVSPGSAPQPSIAAEPAVMEPGEPSVGKPTVIPPNPGESYFDYCIKKANALERAVYCRDESFGSLVVAEKAALGRGEIDRRSGAKALAEFCVARASLHEREQYCND